ncbi:MAG TPA: NRDE family protein [Burkholderiales bacterium]|jgi:uncharacterized protein with NRDE domain|nr:NRDE family protein [Burkholderiales bacterium]
MCLILFAHRAHPRYRLVLAANRDEFLDRPTAVASFWKDAPSVLGGRDLSKGGTWLGVTLDGRWAAITNYREGVRPDPGQRSRGLLAADYLTAAVDARSYATRLEAQLWRYAGFSLLLGDGTGVCCVSNRPPSWQAVAPGVHGLSNHLLDSDWPKVRKGRVRMSALLELEEDALVAALFDLLSDRRQAADVELPCTGVDLAWERTLSASFIVADGYGTRASTVVLIRADGGIRFEERSFGPGAAEFGRRRFEPVPPIAEASPSARAGSPLR